MSKDITYSSIPTIWIQLMVHYMRTPPERMSLQEIFSGGSAVPPILMKLWEERYGVDIVHVWGMTETSAVGTVACPPAGVSLALYGFNASSPVASKKSHNNMENEASIGMKNNALKKLNNKTESPAF